MYVIKVGSTLSSGMILMLDRNIKSHQDEIFYTIILMDLGTKNINELGMIGMWANIEEAMASILLVHLWEDAGKLICMHSMT